MCMKKENIINVKSVKKEAKRLKKDIFPEYEIEILHSKIKNSKKEEVMESFLKNKTNILVATSVVEVGVNIPNATVIIIEGAERFGLAEFDLSIRGSGELYGRRQSGLSDIAMEAMKNIKMVEAAREEAKKIVEKDNELKKYPTIKEIQERKTQKIHFE